MKRLMLALLVVGATVTMISMTTLAFFSAQENSDSNAFTAGTLVFGSPTNATWVNSNMAPGDTQAGNFAMDNAGSLPANHLEIDFANTGGGGDLQEVLVMDTLVYAEDGNDDGDASDEAAPNVVDIISVIVSGVAGSGGDTAATQEAEYNLVLETALDGSTDVAQVDANNDGVITLEELAAAPPIEVRTGTQDDGLAATSDAALYATITLPSGTGNAYQGKGNTLTITFTLNQDNSQ